MSALDRGPHTVTVYVEEESTDSYGNIILVPSATGVTVRGWAQPSTSYETAQLGQDAVTTVYRFLSRTFPGGPFATVTFDGRSWEVLGEPRFRDYGTGRHYTTYLKARTV